MLLIFSSSTLLALFSASEIQIESNHSGTPSVKTGQTQKPCFLIPHHTCYLVTEGEVIHHSPLEKAPASPRLIIHGRQLLKHCSQLRLFFLRETLLIQNQNRSRKLGQSEIVTSTIDNLGGVAIRFGIIMWKIDLESWDKVLLVWLYLCDG
ncbi:hypothetical protein PRUPE_5G064200 [Prunus persica]|uniref:Secreted protein n=1 Tax=Prunus persica TaxID=3760 RepID=A0A251P4M9_PRUPE|nr:hypothetical protein PRUPE_5G064200 [Prunus persica]